MSGLGLCDVCNTRPAIGVASTSVPMSVPYCEECARRGADPEIVFLLIFEDVGTDFSKLADGVADVMMTWAGGKFVSYRDWAIARAKIRMVPT